MKPVPPQLADRPDLMRRVICSAACVIAFLCVPMRLDSREWADSTGTFKVQAEFVRIDGELVHLKRDDSGDVIAVPISRLGEADRKFLQATVGNPPVALKDPFDARGQVPAATSRKIQGGVLAGAFESSKAQIDDSTKQLLAKVESLPKESLVARITGNFSTVNLESGGGILLRIPFELVIDSNAYTRQVASIVPVLEPLAVWKRTKTIKLVSPISLNANDGRSRRIANHLSLAIPDQRDLDKTVSPVSDRLEAKTLFGITDASNGTNARQRVALKDLCDTINEPLLQARQQTKDRKHPYASIFLTTNISQNGTTTLLGLVVPEQVVISLTQATFKVPPIHVDCLGANGASVKKKAITFGTNSYYGPDSRFPFILQGFESGNDLPAAVRLWPGKFELGESNLMIATSWAGHLYVPMSVDELKSVTEVRLSFTE